MPAYQEKRVVPFSAEQMYALVADVKSYPTFLPWVARAYLYHKQDNSFYADLVIGYKLLSLSYTSHVTEYPHEIIKVHARGGPLKHLENIWKFTPVSLTSCEIDFYITFEFCHPLLKKLMETIFHEAVNAMIDSFEKRAKSIYL